MFAIFSGLFIVEVQERESKVIFGILQLQGFSILISEICQSLRLLSENV